MSKTKIIPRGEWVLVLPKGKESFVNEVGLSLPSTEEREQKAQGTVISFGEKVKTIKKDDIVVYGAYAGENIKIRENGNEVEYKLLRDEDIIAFLK